MSDVKEIILAGDMRQAADLADVAESLPMILTTTEEVEQATSLMSRAKDLWKHVEERRVFHKAPLADLVKKIDATAKKVQTPMTEIEETCKRLLRRWTLDQEIERQRKEDAAMAEAEVSGRETPDLTVTEVEVYVPEVSTRQYARVRIRDESLLDRKYLVPNTPLIEADVKAGVPVQGAELYYETVVVNRG